MSRGNRMSGTMTSRKLTADQGKPLLSSLGSDLDSHSAIYSIVNCFTTDLDIGQQAYCAIDSRKEPDNLHPSEENMREQLARILRSPVFSQSDRISRFLRYIVEQTINGNKDYLKEYVIGSEVYDRKPPYHPSRDSIVRTEAWRLRAKLKEYYQGAGKDDLVFIYLRPGSYIPVFQYKEDFVVTQKELRGDNLLEPAPSSTLAIGILPFRDTSGTTLSSKYARAIPDELAYKLMQTGHYRVIAFTLMNDLNAQQHDVSAMMNKVGIRIAVEGSVREEDNNIRVTASIVNDAGFQLWVKRFDTESRLGRSFATEEEIAATLSAELDSLSYGSRQGHTK